MKRLLVLLIAFCGIVYSQEVVRTTPQVHEWITIYDGTVGKYGDQDTSLAIAAKGWEGVLTIVVDWDTLAAGDDSDSCLTVYCELKHSGIGSGGSGLSWNESINALDTGLGWGGYYDGTAIDTKIDTIARSYEGVYTLFLDLGAHNEFIWADSVRFIFGLGTGDSSLLRVEAGGL